MAKQQMFAVRISDELRARLEAAAERDRRSMGFIARDAIEDYLNRIEEVAHR